MLRIGLFGGSFNPVHLGHLIIAEQFTEELELDKCFFVPSYISPFKSESTYLRTIYPGYRIEMIRLAIASNNKFDIDTYEIERGGVSYTIDTVRHFHEKFPLANLFMLIGEDNLVSFQEWKDWEEIIDIMAICIARRHSGSDEDTRNELIKLFTYSSKEPVWIESPMIDISSGDIRKRISFGISIRYLVPSDVEYYIKENNLYK